MNGLQGRQALFRAASDEMTWNASTDVDEDSAREPRPQELDITIKDGSDPLWWPSISSALKEPARRSGIHFIRSHLVDHERMRSSGWLRTQERHPFHQESFGWSWKNEVQWVTYHAWSQCFEFPSMFCHCWLSYKRESACTKPASSIPKNPTSRDSRKEDLLNVTD